VLEDLDVMSLEKLEAVEGAYGILVIVENRYFHGC
jgi:hypothetical protein